MDSCISILHLSDLHFPKKPISSQKIILEGLLNDLAGWKNTAYAPDVVVFSGDIVNAGGTGQTSDALDVLLRILDAVSLDESRLVMAPGNHEADRGYIAKNIDELHMFRSLVKRDATASDLAKADFYNYVTKAFEEYSTLNDQFSPLNRTFSGTICSAYNFRDIGFITVNSAILSSAGLADEERELAIPESALTTAIESLPTSLSKIVVGHHPLDWLEPGNAKIIRAVLEANSAIYFHGHVHEAEPTVSMGPAGQLTSIKGGALFESRERWCGYGITLFSPHHRGVMIRYRKWMERLRQFGDANDTAINGLFFPDEDSRKFFSNEIRKNDRVALDRWRLTELVPAVEEQCGATITDKGLDAIFVPPTFESEVPFRRESEERIGSKTETLTYNELLEDDQNYLISARQESGKSTLLKHFCIQSSKRSATEKNWMIPVYLNFQILKDYEGDILRKAKAFIGTLPEGSKFEDFLNAGRVVFCIDDVDFRNTKKKQAVQAFVSKYPKCRFIITTSTLIVDSAGLRPEIVPDIPFIKLNLKALKSRDVLNLIEKHSSLDPVDADRMLQRVISEAEILNVPLTPVTSTFLIRILLDNADDQLHEANIIERYVSLVLDRFGPQDLLPGSFNFQNKVDLLGFLAEEMTRRQQFDLEINDCSALIVRYLQKYGMKYKASDIYEYMVNSRILEESSDSVTFRLRMFYEWFVANRMNQYEEFKEYIFDDSRYLQFPNEISLYCALNLRDSERLEEVFQKYIELDRRYWKDQPQDTRDGRLLETYSLPHSDDGVEELEALSDTISTPDVLKETREAVLEGVDLEDEADQRIVRPEFASDGDKWNASLVLISVMLKHLELVEDEKKKAILREVLDGWIRFMARSLTMIPTVARERRMVFNGVTYRSTFPDDMPVGEVARRMALYFPIAAARTATRLLGTEKLEGQLEEGLGNPSEPAGRQFLRFAILADLKVRGISDRAESVEGVLRGNKYLLEVLARKVHEVAIKYRLPEAELVSLRDVVARIVAPASGTKKELLNKRRVRVIEGMKRTRAMITLQEKAKDK